MEKMKTFFGDRKVISVCNFHGRYIPSQTVRGIAKCSPEDTFSVTDGCDLAHARCNLKLSSLILDDALTRYNDALSLKEAIDKELACASKNLTSARKRYSEAKETLTSIEKKLS